MKIRNRYKFSAVFIVVALATDIVYIYLPDIAKHGIIASDDGIKIAAILLTGGILNAFIGISDVGFPDKE